MSPDDGEFTALLASWRAGNKEAGDELVTIAYERLRELAALYLHRERADHTLQATALVHELYLKLFSSSSIDWNDRAHFFAIAARQLRRILVDHARHMRADKRGGNARKVSLTEARELGRSLNFDILDVDGALTRLETLNSRAASGVELRFFAGLTEEESAAVLGISLVTLHRDWKFARAWLISQFMPSDRDTQ
jgi:RNA polymerase sigma factor (TIGR02999 family)